MVGSWTGPETLHAVSDLASIANGNIAVVVFEQVVVAIISFFIMFIVGLPTGGCQGAKRPGGALAEKAHLCWLGITFIRTGHVGIIRNAILDRNSKKLALAGLVVGLVVTFRRVLVVLDDFANNRTA